MSIQSTILYDNENVSQVDLDKPIYICRNVFRNYFYSW